MNLSRLFRIYVVLALQVAAVMTIVMTAACSGDRRAPAADQAPSGVVDSILPIPVLLDRFREQLPDTPTVLGGGGTSPEHLTRQLVAALSARDTATALTLVINVAEFAWLYYPHTKFAKPPYELGPELAWLTGMGGGPRGLNQLFNKLGGQRLRLVSLACTDSTLREGPNTVIPGCRVRLAVADSAPRDVKLFSAILVRDGRYKFIAYDNDY